MGSSSSGIVSFNHMTRQIGTELNEHHKISLFLRQFLNEMAFQTAISSTEVELLHMRDRIHSDILRLKTDRPIVSVPTFSGMGELKKINGKKIFEGEFVNGKRKGYGIEYDDNMTIIYEGEFHNNYYHGWGKTPCYEGGFSKGRKNGWGIYEGEVQNYSLKGEQKKVTFYYEGQWRNNLCHGTGALNVRKDNIEQFLKSSSLIDPDSKDEFRYVGNWRQGHFAGMGKLVSKNQLYEGQFAGGYYEGIGSIKSKQDKEASKFQFEKGNKVKRLKK